MEKYFDAIVYYANWGTHWYMLRFPRASLDIKAMKKYGMGEALTLRPKGQYLIAEFRSEDEDGDWDGEGENWMASLLSLRADLLGGDLRSLYLGWLASAQDGDLDDDASEPPLPPGLGKLSAPLKNLAEFLRIDPDLLRVAAQGSPPAPKDDSAAVDPKDWIRTLAQSEKDDMLLRVLQGEAVSVRQQLQQRFRQTLVRKGLRKADTRKEKRRTVAELRAVQVVLAQERDRRKYTL